MQSAIWSGIGEPVKVYAPRGVRERVKELLRNRPPPTEGRAVFAPSGEVVQGADGAPVASGDMQFRARLSDAALVTAMVRGAVIERVDTGERFVVDAVDETNRGEVYAVTVRRHES